MVESALVGIKFLIGEEADTARHAHARTRCAVWWCHCWSDSSHRLREGIWWDLRGVGSAETGTHPGYGTRAQWIWEGREGEIPPQLRRDPHRALPRDLVGSGGIWWELVGGDGIRTGPSREMNPQVYSCVLMQSCNQASMCNHGEASRV